MKQLLLKCLLILIAFQILNQSIDAIEFTPASTGNSIGDFNDINTGVEYFSEVVLGIKNFFPEFQKKQTTKQSQTLKHITIKLFQPTAISILIKSPVSTIVYAYPIDEKHSFLFLKDVTPQPPKA